MIEATCSACGTQNRIAESDVPPGALFTTCASCKARIPVPGAAAKKLGIPAIPRVPAIPKPGAPAAAPPPPIPVPPPADAKANEIIDLSDLPAPRRQSPLAGTQPESKAAPRSGLSAAFDGDLPAPRPRVAPAGPLDLDDLIPPADLPAPKARAQAPSLPPRGLDVDLPAPKARPGLDADLPAPKARPGLDADLPAPKARGLDVDLPAPKARGLDVELPAPKAPRPGLDADLPAPKARGGGSVDLPAPRGRPQSNALDLELDLPAPRAGGGGDDFSDLPMPARPPSSVDLPTPARAHQQPRGADLPTPARAHQQPRGADLPTPKGSTDLPAPLGFFDDLPQPSRGPAAKGAGTDIAPVGFFDDLPQPASRERNAGDSIAPKGFFDDLPQPARAPSRGGPEELPPAAENFFDDLAPPTAAPTRSKAPSRGIDLGEEPIEAIDLADETPALDLAEPDLGDLGDLGSLPPMRAASPPSRAAAPPAAEASSFDDLDLSTPSPVQGAVMQKVTGGQKALDEDHRGGIKFDASKSNPAKPAERGSLPPLGRGGPSTDDGMLELEEPRKEVAKLGPKPERKSQAQAPIKKPVNKKLVLGVVLGLAAAGAGGFVFYQKRAAAAERQASIDSEMQKARAALASPSPDRWGVASRAVAKVLEIDPKNAAAAGIGAEAAIAGAYADGQRMTARIQQGKRMISDALASGLTPELERAQAVAAISSNPQVAIDKLGGLVQRTPGDPNLSLYLGWAQARNGNLPEAIKAFDAAATAPATKSLALLGRARAKLELADSEGARTDFAAILAEDKENIAAMIGLAAALPAGQSQQQESDLLAVLARQGIEKADPRALTLAWTLAGDAARKAGRLDVARDRYRKALALDENDVGAVTSLAAVELADGKLAAAQEQVDKALLQAKGHAPALLVNAELSIASRKLDAAAAILDELEARQPPLPALLLARVGLVRGKLAEAREDHEGAITAYVAAAKLAGELDLAPTMAAIAKLTAMAKSVAGKDAAKETEYKQRADELLSSLAAAATKDPSLAFTLGVAYLQTGEAAQAEPWLRKVVDARPSDPDAIYQLAKALRSLGRGGESLAQLKKAVQVAPERTDIAVELAKTYEAIKNDDEAGKLYDSLLTRADPTLELRAYAGMFYLRVGKQDKAGEQGKALLAADKDNPAGHYLAGEGALSAGELDDAKREFSSAVQLDRSAIHLDALARSLEAIAVARNDVAAQDSAILNYKAAIELDPTTFTSQRGLGRVYVTRFEMEKGVPPLLAADKLKEKDPDVAFYLGKAYAKMGEHKTALAWLASSESARPTADTAFEMAQVYTSPAVDNGGAAEGAFARAVQRAEEANKKDSTALPAWYGDALFSLGSLADANGHLPAAREAFNKFLATSPRSKAKVDEARRKLGTGLRQ